MDLDIDEEETFELVGPGQENPDKGRILSTMLLQHMCNPAGKPCWYDIPSPCQGRHNLSITKAWRAGGAG